MDYNKVTEIANIYSGKTKMIEALDLVHLLKLT